MELTTILFTLLGVYALVTGVFLISENRRPQSTLAWLLAFIFAPGLGVLVYLFFGRDAKAFSYRAQLLKQDLAPQAQPLLAAVVSRQEAAISALEDEGASHRKLMTLVRQNSQSTLATRHRVEIQQNAAVFYSSLVHDIRAARHSIHLQYYIWRSDDFTKKLKALLIDKVNEGVEVRLLYDSIGSIFTSRKYLQSLRAAGVQVSPTTSYHWLHTISYRNHRKITVIDGMIGYLGGMNIGQEHLDGGKGFRSWRDTQVRIVGEGATLLQAVFMVDWYNAVRENLFLPSYFPTDVAEFEEGPTPLQILTSGPDSQWAAIRQLYSNMIVTAQRHVYLQSPYFILDATIAEALALAALSGVDVKVMLSARASGDVVPNWAGNTYIAEIAKSGVRVYLYQKSYLHAKTISIDSQICSIGSANMDIRSFSINYEINAVLYCARLAEELERAFQQDLADCVEFNAAEYERSNVFARFRDSVARLLSPLL